MRRDNQRVCHAYRSLSFITFTLRCSTDVVIITTQLRNHARTFARVSLPLLLLSRPCVLTPADAIPQFAASTTVIRLAPTSVALAQSASETWTRHPVFNASARKASGRPQPTTKAADVC